MFSRPAMKTIAVLRRTLRQMKDDLHPTFDVEAVAELERIVLLRIAELECEVALESQLSPIIATPAAAPSQPFPEEEATSTDNAA